MKEIKKEMIKDFEINKLKFDFMGYTFNNTKELSFHHLIIPRRYCEFYNIGDGFYKWNGTILNQNTSHDYLHIIERLDYDLFLAITSELIDENLKGKIDIENLKKIRELLLIFEKEHKYDKTKKGNVLIKREFLYRRIDL